MGKEKNTDRYFREIDQLARLQGHGHHFYDSLSDSVSDQAHKKDKYLNGQKAKSEKRKPV